MPLFIGAYLADTQRLNTEQHGAYLLLIMDYWMNGAPPDDDDELAQITKLSLSAWKKTKAKITKFFNLSDGRWYHKRIEKELTAAKMNKGKAVEKAKAAAAARWSKNTPERSPEQHEIDAPSNAPSMLQALQQAKHGALHEGLHEQCPLPIPIPSNTLGTNTVHGDCEVGGDGLRPIRAAELTSAMREFGIQANPADPRLIALAEQKVMPETVRAACEEAKRSKPNERIAAGYIVSIIERWAKEASNLKASGAKAPAGGTTKFDPVAFVNRNRVSDNRGRPDDNIIDV